MKISLIVFLFLTFNITCAQVLDLNFRKIPVDQLLQLVAKAAHKNIVVSDKVAGEMNIHLQQVTWKTALDVIAVSQKLVVRDVGDNILVAPQGYWQKTKSVKQSAKVIALHFANAKQMVALLKAEQGQYAGSVSAFADERTNTIVLTGRRQAIQSLLALIKQLDKPVKQVMIVARIVSVDKEQEKELGIRFTSTRHQEVAHTIQSGFNLDMPVVDNHAARLGLALFKLKSGVRLDMELSALESQGYAKVISSPKLIAANHQAATIEAGQEIPYQEKTLGGSTSVAFKKAVLSLKVTPEIIPNGKILLHLQVNQDKRSAKEVQGVPAIDTRQINTLVLVKNGQTMVLGGIYEHTRSQQVLRVPFLSQVPLLGALFRYKKWVNSQQELLIFVTPKEVEESLWQKKRASS